jgi:hypothetical protein
MLRGVERSASSVGPVVNPLVDRNDDQHPGPATGEHTARDEEAG